MKLSLLILAAVAVGTQAVCPNLCSGHGTCGANDLCTCYANWQGKDCSARTCAYDFAWVPASHYGSQATQDYDFPGVGSTKDYAHGLHYYAECSNKGTCDRKTGLCKCNAGYEGKACKRSSCPAGCSGHGTCETIGTLSGTTAEYKNWDTNKIQGCKCDPYYTGHDCSSRMCPKGDDPLTSGSTVSQLTITVRGNIGGYCHAVGDATVSVDLSGTVTSTACTTEAATNVFVVDGALSGSFTLTYTDSYGAEWETWPITLSGTYDDKKQNIVEALEGLPNRVIESVSVVQTTTGTTDSCSDGSSGTEAACVAASKLWYRHQTITYAIDFAGATNSGSQSGNLAINFSGCNVAGCQPRYAGLAQSGNSNDPAIVATVAESQGADAKYEGVTCGNRGDCDGTTGLCTCHSGYTGEACSEQTALA